MMKTTCIRFNMLIAVIDRYVQYNTYVCNVMMCSGRNPPPQGEGGGGKTKFY